MKFCELAFSLFWYPPLPTYIRLYTSPRHPRCAHRAPAGVIDEVQPHCSKLICGKNTTNNNKLVTKGIATRNELSFGIATSNRKLYKGHTKACDTLAGEHTGH